MFPKTDEDSRITQRKSKSFIGLRLSKILPSFYNKKDNNKYVFDAEPAVPREGSSLGLSLTSNNVSSNYGNPPTNVWEKRKTNEEERKDDKNFDQDPQDKTNKEDKEGKANENKSSNKKNNIPRNEKSFEEKFQNRYIKQNNVIIHNGTNIHIGEVFSTVNNNTVVYNTNNTQFGENWKNQQGSKKKISQPIKTLMKSKNKIENRHLQFLSCHFGDERKGIGKHLNLTKEEISNKKHRMKESEEKSYQMMLAWKQKPENQDTTLGSLCKILWDSQKKAAQEAVEQLAANLNNLD